MTSLFESLIATLPSLHLPELLNALFDPVSHHVGAVIIIEFIVRMVIMVRSGLLCCNGHPIYIIYVDPTNYISIQVPLFILVLLF